MCTKISYVSSNLFYVSLIKERNATIIIFADSLNNYSGGKLPAFLFDKCFDQQSGLWEGLHSPVSLRWEVLEKVNNKNALKLILEKNDRRLKRKCSYDNHGEYPQLVIPMIEKSFYELIEERYEQLKVHIEGVNLKDDILNILFENESNKSIIVPAMENRVSENENTLNSKFFKYSGDTIFIYLKKEVDKDLYTLKVSHKTSHVEGKFFYADKKLSPKMNYWTSIKLNKPGNLKVLVLKYEEFLWISPIN